EYAREHGPRRARQIAWKDRDHALFVAFAPVAAPRYVCATVVEHGGVSGGGGSAVAGPLFPDALLGAPRRGPARPRPGEGRSGPFRRACPTPLWVVGRLIGGRPDLGARAARTRFPRKAPRAQLGACDVGPSGLMLWHRGVVFGRRRQHAAMGSDPDDTHRDRS